MDIVYHIGAHGTGEFDLLKCLQKNATKLEQEDIVFVPQKRFRPVLRDAVSKLKGAPASPDMQEAMLDAMLDTDHAKRIILSHNNFLCTAGHAVKGGSIYPMAGPEAAKLRNLFPELQVGFCMGVRNPATFLPALFTMMDEQDFASFTSNVDLAELSWSNTILRICEAVPDAPIAVWCYEDTPLLWPNILQTITGHAAETALIGYDDFLATIMTSDGLSRLQGFIAEHPPQTEDRRRHVVGAFLEKFGLPDEMEMEIDLPGWSQDIIDGLTEVYDEDMRMVEDLPGVTLLM